MNYSVEPTLRRTNGIPVKLTDRLNYLASIFQNEKFIEYYNKAPPRNTSSIDQITRYITKYTGPKGEIEIYAMIFYYICNQITYDRTGIDNDKDNDFTDVRGLGGYPGLAFRVSVNDNLEAIRGKVTQ